MQYTHNTMGECLVETHEPSVQREMGGGKDGRKEKKKKKERKEKKERRKGGKEGKKERRKEGKRRPSKRNAESDTTTTESKPSLPPLPHTPLSPLHSCTTHIACLCHTPCLVAHPSILTGIVSCVVMRRKVRGGRGRRPRGWWCLLVWKKAHAANKSQQHHGKIARRGKITLQMVKTQTASGKTKAKKKKKKIQPARVFVCFVVDSVCW